TIVLVFVLVRRMGGDALLALLSAALVAVLPVSVYFGRNLMPDVPALCGLLGFFVLFLGWLDRPGLGVAAGAGLALAFAGLCKLSFLVPAVAVLGWVPWQRILDDLRTGRLARLLGFASFLICPAVLAWMASRHVLLDQETGVSFLTNVHPLDRIDPIAFLRPSYWARNGPSIRLYCIDNYTSAFAWVALAGVVRVAFGPLPARMRRHLVGMVGALCVFLAVFHDFVNAHSYYQLPFLAAFSMLCAGALLWPFDWLARRLDRPTLRLLVWLPLLLNARPIAANIDRHFSTQTFGLDVAGRFIAERAAPDERFVFFGSFPNAGVCTLAERFCIFLPPDVERLQQFEERFGSRFLYVPHKYWRTLQAHASWPYLAEHYAIVQVAVRVDGTQRSLEHYVLERGAPYERLPLRGIEYVPAARYEVGDRHVEVHAATLSRD
ncbi:MAG: phospholipid carrier-dependent glycosyltransferase, partial [Myxococcales bacterium]|nr:phospholipid carrier-dependent glycosyltransferase [Myxococcales bacterium]